MPSDLTLSISVVSGLASPAAIAIDAQGEAWVTNTAGNFVTKISPIGALLSGANGYTSGGINGAQGIAIDYNGYAWIANTGNNTVIRMTPVATRCRTVRPITTATCSFPTAWPSTARAISGLPMR